MNNRVKQAKAQLWFVAHIGLTFTVRFNARVRNGDLLVSKLVLETGLGYFRGSVCFVVHLLGCV